MAFALDQDDAGTLAKTGSIGGVTAVIPLLGEILDNYQIQRGNLTAGFIFTGMKGSPLDLDTLAHDFIEPALATKNIHWYWYHAFRRGPATNLHRLGVPDNVIQAIPTTRELGVTMSASVKKDVPSLRLRR
jgi:hypothetical protein